MAYFTSHTAGQIETYCGQEKPGRYEHSHRCGRAGTDRPCHVRVLVCGRGALHDYVWLLKYRQVAERNGHYGMESPGRPQCQAVLLEMVQAVLRPDPSLSSQSIVTPPSDVDTATVILIRWGTTLPWAWRTWQDARLYNSEVIECLVSAEYKAHAHFTDSLYSDYDVAPQLGHRLEFSASRTFC